MPPLLGLSHAAGIDMEQDLQSIKKKNNRLVDGTITHLKEATGVTSKTTVNQKVDKHRAHATEITSEG